MPESSLSPYPISRASDHTPIGTSSDLVLLDISDRTRHSSSKSWKIVPVDDEQPAPGSDRDDPSGMNFVGGDGRDTSDTSGLNLQVEAYFKRLSRLGAELSCFLAALVLGAFGSFMSRWSLWVCWAIVVLKLLMDFSIRPSWAWLISYLSTRSDKICPSCPPVGLHISADDRARGEASASIIKCALCVVLMLKMRDLGLSDGCSSPPCSERAKESLWGLAVVVIALEGVPLCLCMGLAQARLGGSGVERLKRSCHLLRHALHAFWTDASVTWWQFALILQSFHASASSAVLVSTAALLVGGNFGNFMTRSCYWLCMSIVLIELLAEKCCPLAIEMFRYFCARRVGQPSSSPTHTEETQQQQEYEETPLQERIAGKGLHHVNEDLVAEAKAKLVLRVLVHGVVCSFLSILVHRKTYYPESLDPNFCDATCKANTEALLLVLCIFTGSQVASILPLWAPCQILAALLPAFLLFGLFFIMIFTLPLLLVGYVIIFTLGQLLSPGVSVGVAAAVIFGYIMLYIMVAKRRKAWLITKLHYLVLFPVAFLGGFLAYFTRQFIISGAATIACIIILYIVIVILCRRNRQRTRQRLPKQIGDVQLGIASDASS